MSRDEEGGGFSPALARACIRLRHPNQRVSPAAAELTAEFLRRFVVEARRRAAIEVREGAVCGVRGDRPTVGGVATGRPSPGVRAR